MSCTPLSQNYTPRDCKKPAGVVRYLVTPFANVLTSTITAGVVTAITKTVAFKEYKQEPEIANFKSTATGDGKTSSYAYDYEVNFETTGLETLQSDELEKILAQKMFIVAEMANGDYYELGLQYGLHTATMGFESGVAFGDFQGDKIQLKGRGTRRPKKVDSGIIAGLLTV